MEKEELEKKDDNIKNSENTNSDNDKELNKDEHQSEIKLEEKIKFLEDKIARILAETENQRRRHEKEKEDAFEYGGFAFAKEALNLLDNLERSKESLSNDQSLKKNIALEKITEHLNIIYEDMLSIFKKNNIEPIKSIDEKLDPNLHQAMMEIIDDKKESGTIVQEIQKGFLMKDRLLRPSLVGVSKKSLKNNDITNQDGKKDKENQDKIKEK